MGSIDPAISIPLIDISPFLSPSATQESHDGVVSAVRSACEDYGFFQLTGHGIPLSLQREILLCAKRFFDLPLDQKQAIAMSKSMGISKRGYEVGQKLDVKPDTKEGFYLGFDIDENDPRAGTFLKGPNFWPAALTEEEFKIPVMEYHTKVLQLHETLLKILAIGLPYEDDVFDDFMKDPVANIKLLHYPPNLPRESPDELSLGGGLQSSGHCQDSRILTLCSRGTYRFRLHNYPASTARPTWSSSPLSAYKFLDLGTGKRRYLHCQCGGLT
jgi:isopenicillin N synthase-like dioxygenase